MVNLIPRIDIYDSAILIPNNIKQNNDNGTHVFHAICVAATESDA